MTPAINNLKKNKIKFLVHSYDHDPKCMAYGEEAAEKLKVPPDRIFKTLIVSLENKWLAVALVPVAGQLDLKKMSNVCRSKKAAMADKNEVVRSTGYLLGGVSPIAQKKKLKTIIDAVALNFDRVYVSAGRRGLQIEISPKILGKITHSTFADISR